MEIQKCGSSNTLSSGIYSVTHVKTVPLGLYLIGLYLVGFIPGRVLGVWYIWGVVAYCGGGIWGGRGLQRLFAEVAKEKDFIGGSPHLWGIARRPLVLYSYEVVRSYGGYYGTLPPRPPVVLWKGMGVKPPLTPTNLSFQKAVPPSALEGRWGGVYKWGPRG